LVEETGVPVENHGPATSHWQTLLHNVVIYYMWSLESSNLLIDWIKLLNANTQMHTIQLSPKSMDHWISNQFIHTISFNKFVLTCLDYTNHSITFLLFLPVVFEQL
jgi:hypothetical protein